MRSTCSPLPDSTRKLVSAEHDIAITASIARIFMDKNT